MARGGIFTQVSSPAGALKWATWHHVTAVCDSATDELRLYVDGRLQPGTLPYAAGADLSAGDLLVGANGEMAGADFMSGRLADLAIWRRVLSDDDIASLATGLTVQSAGVVSYWPLDETTGVREDSIGGNTLSPVGLVGSEAGKVGNAVDLNRSSSHYLSIGNSAQVDLDIAGDLSLFAWVKPRTVGQIQVAASRGTRSLGYELSYRANSAARFSTGPGAVDSSSTVSTDRWAHIGGIWDGAQRAVYFNSGLENPGAGTTPSSSSSQFVLGGSDAGGEFMDGLLDEVIVANRHFRSEEIRALYLRGLNGMPAFMLAGVLVDPLVVDFGQAPTNVTVTASTPLKIANTNTTPVTVTLTTTAPFGVEGANSTSIPPGGTADFFVNFTPGTVGVVTNVLNVTGPFPTVAVELTGEGVEAFSDSDGDGMPDYWETRYGFDPDDPGDAELDPDEDGLTNLLEYRFRSDPTKSDTDDDGLSDYDEAVLHGSNPARSDSDGDGIPDAWEVAHGLDPRLNDGGDDLDRDGLSNVAEYNWSEAHPDQPLDVSRAFSLGGTVSDYELVTSIRTNRFYYDRNDRLLGGEYPNGLVVSYVYDGNNNIRRQVYSAWQTQTTTLPLPWLLRYGLTGESPAEANGALDDPDGDGWSNHQEWQGGTSPIDPLEVPAVGMRQTAPLAVVLPSTNVLGAWATIPIRLWDGEGNSSIPFLQYREAGATDWEDAEIVEIDGSPYEAGSRVAASPEGADYLLLWYAGASFPGGRQTAIDLRVRADDITLRGDWSVAVRCRLSIEGGVDLDEDGMDDDCEMSWFGTLGHSPDEDADNDGVSNLVECLAGTNPNDPYLVIVAGVDVVRIEWLSSPRVTRSLEQKTTLREDDDWVTVTSEEPPYLAAPSETMLLYRLRDDAKP